MNLQQALRRAFKADIHVPNDGTMASDTLRYGDYAYMRPTTKLDKYPGEYGLPPLGKLMEVRADMNTFARERYKRYGPVSKIRMGLQKGLLVLGPDISKRIFLDNEELFSVRLGYAETLQRFFPGGLLLRDFKDHYMQRRIMQSAFKNHAIRGYVDVLNPLFERLLGRWRFDDKFLFFPAIKGLLLSTSLEVFYGEKEEHGRHQKIFQAFIDATHGQMGLVPFNIPGTRYRTGIKGRDYLRNYVKELIPKHRQSGDESMLSYMCNERSEEGERYSDEEVIGHLNFVLFAAHDTTTSTLNHLIYYLAAHPEWQERLREEARSLNTAHMGYDDLSKVPDMECAMNEALRLHPSVVLLARRPLRDCELGGVQIPAGVRLFHFPCFNHRMEEYWSEPERFDPERFSSERAEHKRHSFQFIPFGGGAHKCIGMHYAMMQAKLFLHQFLLNWRFRLHEGYTAEFEPIPLPKLKDDLPLIVEPL